LPGCLRFAPARRRFAPPSSPVSGTIFTIIVKDHSEKHQTGPANKFAFPVLFFSGYCFYMRKNVISLLHRVAFASLRHVVALLLRRAPSFPANIFVSPILFFLPFSFYACKNVIFLLAGLPSLRQIFFIFG